VHELEPWAVHIDSIGVGFGIAGMLRERFPQLPVLDINVAAASTAVNRAGKPRFANLRAEVWWRMREKIAGYDFRELDALTLEQLGDTRWFENQRGLIQCEPKDAVRRRTGRSPDRADAVLLAAWEPAVGSFQRPAAGKLVVGTPAVPSKRGQAGGKLGVGSAVRQR
jgi:hypothetical protein